MLKKLLINLWPTLATIILIAIGFFIGRYTASLPFNNLIESGAKAYTLRGIVPKDLDKEFLACYDNKVSIDDLDNFSWAPPSIPTPFIGSAALPGKHANAFINSMQMRSNKEVTSPKPENVYRIFITGGSTAYGVGAPSQDQTIGGFVEKFLNERLSTSTGLRYEIFTMAYPGWASTHERIIIENRLSELEPDMVISISGNNDVHWSNLERQDIFWMRTYSDQFFWNLIQSVYRMVGHELMPTNVNTNRQNPPTAPHELAEKLTKNVILSSHALSMKNAQYVFALQPTMAVTRKKLSKRELKILIRRSEFSRELFKLSYSAFSFRLKRIKYPNFYFVDMSGIFDNRTEKDEIFLDSYHFGNKGNRIIARHLLTAILPVIEGKIMASNAWKTD